MVRNAAAPSQSRFSPNQRDFCLWKCLISGVTSSSPSKVLFLSLRRNIRAGIPAEVLGFMRDGCLEWVLDEDAFSWMLVFRAKVCNVVFRRWGRKRNLVLGKELGMKPGFLNPGSYLGAREEQMSLLGAVCQVLCARGLQSAGERLKFLLSTGKAR